MSSNPLQKFYRQPKFYISLPSAGAYNVPGTFEGDVKKVPVYGMTGIDEIISKTPDSLLSGDSMIEVVQSCVPSFKNAWAMNTLDSDLIFAAIKIATWGNKMTVGHVCPHCGSAENEYDLDLTKIVDHFNSCTFNNIVKVGELTIKLRPLLYKQYTDFSMDNFKLQQQLAQLANVEQEERQTKIDELWKELAKIQHYVLVNSIESISTLEESVTDKSLIDEFLKNCDREVTTALKDRMGENKEQWSAPKFSVQCADCSKHSDIKLNLDSSTFFGKA